MTVRTLIVVTAAVLAVAVPSAHAGTTRHTVIGPAPQATQETGHWGVAGVGAGAFLLIAAAFVGSVRITDLARSTRAD